jgi:hypothetical protein
LARIRTIKPEFFTNEGLSTLPEVTHYGMAAGLLTYSDDEGYFNANVALIKAALFPIREPSVSVHDMLTQLQNIGFIELLDGKDGRRYGRVVSFLEHQRVNRPTPSKIKKLVLRGKTHGVLTEDSPPEGKGKEQGNGKEGKGDSTESPSASAPIITLPLNDLTEFPITESQSAEWGTLFPAVNVPQELRNMRAWSLANPTKRKTRTGVLRFVTSWLNREQNQPKARGARPVTGGRRTLADYQSDLRTTDANDAIPGTAKRVV